MSGMLDALRTAAAALLATAPEPIVRRTLRELLALDAGDPAAPRRRRRGHATFPGKVQAAKPDWSDLRRDVRAAMRERGVSFDQVAEQLGFAASTVRNALNQKTPPSLPLVARLTDWLARAQAAGAPFPFRAAAGNGADASA